MEFAVKADIDNWDNISDEIKALLLAHDLCEGEIISFLVAMEEIFANISFYAYPSGKGMVYIKIAVEGKNVSAEFRDNGIPFDPLSVAEPDIAAGSRERTSGGLGIFIARTKTDEIIYNYDNNENQLILRKKFN